MRSSYQSQKPEAALQRAHEFLSVGKEKDALQSLHTLIKVCILQKKFYSIL